MSAGKSVREFELFVFGKQSLILVFATAFPNLHLVEVKITELVYESRTEFFDAIFSITRTSEHEGKKGGERKTEKPRVRQ